jgi:hypothetical protein
MSPQSDFILDNQTGAQFRADLNNALEAMAGFSSGSTAPTTTYAYQYWADTTNNVLKQRDGSNAGWIVRGKLTTDYGQAGQVLTSAGSDEAPIWTSISEDNAWTVAQDATNAHYTFTGNGFDGTETNPDVYLARGSVYNFTNASATQGFQIQSTAGQGGTAYSDGITSNNVTDGTLVWTVQMDAPAQLYYQSTSDSAPGGNIYVLDESGVASSIEWNLTANGTTDYIFAGPGFAGTETDPTVYVMRGQTYKFTNLTGSHPFQIQSTQGTGGTAYNDGVTNNGVSNGTLTWEVRMDAPSTLYYQCTSHALMAGTFYVLDEGSVGGATTIDDLSDVDTSTVAPIGGQALVWDNAASKWEPGTVSGGGGSSSIQTATDFELQPGTFPYWATKTANIEPPAGEWFANGSTIMRANPVDSNGTDWTAEMTALGTTGTFWYSTDAINWTQTTNTGGFDSLPTWFQFSLSPFSVITHTGGIYISFSDPASAPGTPLQNGDFLQWVAADSVFKPTQPSSNTVNGQTGVVSLGIQDMDDFELQPATGTTPITRTGSTSTSSNVASGQIGLSIQGSGFSYWSTNPDGLSGTILDYLVNTASFPIDVDISGTTYSITGVVDDSGSGTPNVLTATSCNGSMPTLCSSLFSLRLQPQGHFSVSVNTLTMQQQVQVACRLAHCITTRLIQITSLKPDQRLFRVLRTLAAPANSATTAAIRIRKRPNHDCAARNL